MQSAATRAALALVFAAGAMIAAWSGIARADTGPRPGVYKVYQVPFTEPSYVYDLILMADGRYEVREFDNTLKSEGQYRYEAAEQRVYWLSGLNWEMGRGGTFSVKEGGVHYILMGPKVYATNGE